MITKRPLILLAAGVMGLVTACGGAVLSMRGNLRSAAGDDTPYEPSWGPPGKLVSAYAEGAAAALALARLLLSLARRRAAGGHRAGAPGSRLTAPEHSTPG